MTRYLFIPGTGLPAIAAFAAALGLTNVSAAPSADVAKRCVHYSYMAYPYKRPGAAPMSGDRQAYIKDCFARMVTYPHQTPPKS